MQEPLAKSKKQIIKIEEPTKVERFLKDLNPNNLKNRLIFQILYCVCFMARWSISVRLDNKSTIPTLFLFKKKLKPLLYMRCCALIVNDLVSYC